MTFTDAAREVLRLSGRPLHYKEITELAIEKNLLSHVGKSPEVTMGARLAATLKKGGDDNPLIRVKPGVFGLSDWDEETIKKGLEIKRAPRRKKPVAAPEKAAAEAADQGASANARAVKPTRTSAAASEETVPTEAKPRARRTRRAKSTDSPVERAARAIKEDEAAKQADEVRVDEAPGDLSSPAPVQAPAAAAPQIDLSTTPRAPDEEMRADLAAGAAEVFAAEDDDDQPILRPVEDSGEPEGRRRRRRRRRRGRSSGDERSERGDRGGLPSYTAAPAFEGSKGKRGPQVIELTPGDLPSLDGAAGRQLATAVAVILNTFDRTVGAVSLRQIAETAQRLGKLSGDIQLAQSQVAAAVRADNSRRSAAGLRPRFRNAGGRVGLTDWLLDPELMRCERDLQQALRRYREAARKSFVRKCNELPGHAFVELCVTVLERVGISQLAAVRFPGSSGAEAHFSGTLHAPAGVLPGPQGTTGGLPIAVVIRKDGRDLGRERVNEVRGNAHHYNNAAMGWLFTAGQVLSGAREEARANNAMAVTMLDGISIARLCEDHNVAVVRSEYPVAIADVDLFEALRSS